MLGRRATKAPDAPQVPEAVPTKPEGKSHGSGTSSGTYYKVEVRTRLHEPLVLGTADRQPFVIHRDWLELPIRLGGAQPYAASIPIRSWDRPAGESGMFTFTVAQAHRWAFLAFLDANHFGGQVGVETRLVGITFSHSYSTSELGVTDALDAGPFNRKQRTDELKPRDASASEAAS